MTTSIYSGAQMLEAVFEYLATRPQARSCKLRRCAFSLIVEEMHSGRRERGHMIYETIVLCWVHEQPWAISLGNKCLNAVGAQFVNDLAVCSLAWCGADQDRMIDAAELALGRARFFENTIVVSGFDGRLNPAPNKKHVYAQRFGEWLEVYEPLYHHTVAVHERKSEQEPANQPPPFSTYVPEMIPAIADALLQALAP